MLIYKNDTLEYAVKTRSVINESSNSIRDAGNESISRYVYFGCADKKLLYTFSIMESRIVDLESFSGNLTEDTIENESISY